LAGRTLKIFISYSWEDKELVRQLEEVLADGGAEVWVDRSKMRAGENLPKLDVMLTEYYDVRGWGEDGIPTDEKLKSLGLEECL